MSLRDDLVAAKALIDAPEKWIKGQMASNNRSCFCTRGAINEAVADYDRLVAVEEALEAFIPKRLRPKSEWMSGIVSFNDRKATTHADIMALFDRAIAAAEPQP